MIEWWGPVLYEYYAGTEVQRLHLHHLGEWLAHKGSVGRPLRGEVAHPGRGLATACCPA